MFKNKKKLIKTGIILGLIVSMVIGSFATLFFMSFESDEFIMGTHFSKQYAKYFGLDWKKTYIEVLDDLQVKHLRIAAQWNEIEYAKDKYNFQDLDWMVHEAEKRDVELIMVVGRRTPRWPECHEPKWIEDKSYEYTSDHLLSFITTVINRYKKYDHIKVWQVENEPFLNLFGDCPPSDYEQLKREISLVKTLDDSRPILVTDSGELSWWIPAAKVSDNFGTTLYRVTHNKFTGYAFYYLPPVFYYAKSKLVGRDPSDILVVELQAEPWAPAGLLEISLEEQFISMNPERLKKHVDYSKRSGFGGAYLWGVEWWYWLKESKQDDSMWEAGKSVFEEYKN